MRFEGFKVLQARQLGGLFELVLEPDKPCLAEGPHFIASDGCTCHHGQNCDCSTCRSLREPLGGKGDA